MSVELEPATVGTRSTESLPVFDFGGTPRSGKGTIVGHLEETFPGVVVEETGIHYRGYTAFLIDEGIISPDMSGDEIVDKVSGMSEERLEDIGLDRDRLIGERPVDDFYKGAVEKLVPYIGQVANIRTIVKHSLQDRVEGVVAKGDAQSLMLDGRNLWPVVEGIQGVSLALRTFVWCVPIEAAQRQSAKERAVFGGQRFKEIFADIKNRFIQDSTRPNDPVTPEPDAIDYWHDFSVIGTTTDRLVELMQDPEFVAARYIDGQPDREYLDDVRFGAGKLAAETGRQISFDTTHFRGLSRSQGPVSIMLKAAEVMYEEARGVHAQRTA